jgi:hypothetical protein
LVKTAINSRHSRRWQSQSRFAAPLYDDQIDGKTCTLPPIQISINRNVAGDVVLVVESVVEESIGL